MRYYGRVRHIDEKIVERCIRATEEKVCPGGVIGFVRTNGERQVYPFGRFTYESSSPPVEDETIYDVASITKSIPTSSLILALIEKGAIRLDDAISKYIPEYDNKYRDVVSVWHLLTYTIDSEPLSAHQNENADRILQFIYTRELQGQPGSSFHYSNTPALLMGLIVERVMGVGLAQAAHDTFLKPLGMKRTGFLPQQKLHKDIPPTEITEDGEIKGMVHDESARVFAKEERVVGHAGLFSCAPDLLNFLEMLLNGGELHGRRYFSNKTIRDMATNQIEELGNSTGLGWELNQPHFMGQHRSIHTFGKTGFTGTSVVCDIERDVAFCMLSNRTYPKRPLDNSAINAFRGDVADVVLQK